jgi:hypothetical protein
VEAWLQRRQGDRIEPSLVGRQVTYDFTAVEENGREADYLNLIRPAGVAPTVVKDEPEAPAKSSVTAAKKTTKKPVRRKARARKKQQ